MLSSVSILGNPVGTGKTRIITALVALIKSQAPAEPAAHTDTPDCIISPLVVVKRRVKTSPCTIVHVGNDQISVQWEREAKICGLRSFTVFTNKHADQLVDLAGNHDILIVRGVGFKALLDKHKDIKWALFVFDEPDCHINPSFRDIIPALFHILVTATWEEMPTAHYGRSNYLHQIGMRSDEWYKYDLKSIVINTSHKLKMPVPVTRSVYFKPSVGDAILRGLFSAEVDRLIDADNWEAVAKLIGTKVTTKTLPEVAMESLQKEMNKAAESEARAQEVIPAFAVGSPDYNSMTHLIQNAKKDVVEIGKRMEILKERIINHEHEGCTICLEDTLKNATMTPCHHVFCQACIVQWLRGNRHSQACPNCRTSISADKLTTVLRGKSEADEGPSELMAESIVGRGASCALHTESRATEAPGECQDQDAALFQRCFYIEKGIERTYREWCSSHDFGRPQDNSAPKPE